MSRWKILVVDDEKEIAEYIGSLVRGEMGEAVEVEVLYSGTRAKERLARGDIHLLVSDIVMPVTNGLMLLEYVAENTPDTEVILLTAHEEFEYIYKANRIKSCDYIVKTEQEIVIRRGIHKAVENLEKRKRTGETVETAKRQIEEVKQLFSEEEARRMLTYEEPSNEDILVIQKIKAYIKKNIREDLTAASVAEAFHYSPAYLSKIFKENGKEKLSVFIMRMKIKEAKRLLTETDDTICSIAMQLGYQSPQAFARAFGRELAMTPQEYRREYKRRKP